MTLTVTEKGYLPGGERGRFPRERPRPAPRARAGAVHRDQLRQSRRERRASCARRCSPRATARCATGSRSKGAFPQTMVDRIVPATDEADIEALAGAHRPDRPRDGQGRAILAMGDRGRFAGERPDFEAAGVQHHRRRRPVGGGQASPAQRRAQRDRLSGRARPASNMSTGSSPARRAGASSKLCGTSSNRPCRRRRSSTSPPIARRLLRPFRQRRRSPTARARSRSTVRRRLPQRLLAPIAERLERGQSIEALALAVAAWIAGKAGGPTPALEVDDPLAGRDGRRIVG